MYDGQMDQQSNAGRYAGKAFVLRLNFTLSRPYVSFRRIHESLGFSGIFFVQFGKALEMTFMQLCLVLIVLSLQAAKACVIIGIISMRINASSSTAYWDQIKYPDVNCTQVTFFEANRLGCGITI